MFKYLTGQVEKTDEFFSAVPRVRTRGNSHKSK